MVRGLSLRPNLPEGPEATWDSRRSIKEEEEEKKMMIVTRVIVLLCQKFNDHHNMFFSEQNVKQRQV
jgi:hypothetical protein